MTPVFADNVSIDIYQLIPNIKSNLLTKWKLKFTFVMMVLTDASPEACPEI